MLQRTYFPRFDREQTINHTSVILGIRLDSKDEVKRIIEKLKGEIIGLHTRMDGDYIVQRKDGIKIRELPNENGMSLKNLAKWAGVHCKLDLSKELGLIAANDDSIILHLNHSVCDGKYLVGVAEHLGDPPKKLDNYLPLLFNDEFKDQLKEREKYPPHYYYRSDYNTKFDKFDTAGGSEQINEQIFDVESMTCYNKKTKKCHNLTSAIMTGFLLSINAFQNNESFDKIGAALAANLRGILQSKPSIRHCNIFTMINAGIDVTPYTKLSECHERLAKSVKKNFDDKLPLFDFCHMLSIPDQRQMPNDGILTCFSHIGPLQLKSPAKDLYIYNFNNDVPFSFAIPLMTYALIDERTGRNEFHSNLRYKCNYISEKTANILNQSLRHYLQTFNPNDQIRDVLIDLKSFQRNL